VTDSVSNDRQTRLSWRSQKKHVAQTIETRQCLWCCHHGRAIARVHRVHLMNVERRQAVADPQTNPAQTTLCNISPSHIKSSFYVDVGRNAVNRRDKLCLSPKRYRQLIATSGNLSANNRCRHSVRPARKKAALRRRSLFIRPRPERQTASFTLHKQNGSAADNVLNVICIIVLVYSYCQLFTSLRRHFVCSRSCVLVSYNVCCHCNIATKG